MSNLDPIPQNEIKEGHNWRDWFFKLRELVNSISTTVNNLVIGVGSVVSFNLRTGIVTLTSSDVTTALGFTPGTGNGTVTTVSVVTANGVSGTVATDTTTPAITLALGDITPNSVVSTLDSTFNGVTVGVGGGGILTNTVLGAGALANNTAGGNGNVAVGVGALGTATTANTNIAIGNALPNLIDGSDNIGIGDGSLVFNLHGVGNIAIGVSAGGNETGSNTLYIDGTGTATTTPLIGGNFDPTGGLAGNLVINGTFGVNALAVYPDNASAVTGGLLVGQFYRTGADPDPVMVVH